MIPETFYIAGVSLVWRSGGDSTEPRHFWSTTSFTWEVHVKIIQCLLIFHLDFSGQHVQLISVYLRQSSYLSKTSMFGPQCGFQNNRALLVHVRKQPWFWSCGSPSKAREKMAIWDDFPFPKGQLRCPYVFALRGCRCAVCIL